MVKCMVAAVSVMSAVCAQAAEAPAANDTQKTEAEKIAVEAAVEEEDDSSGLILSASVDFYSDYVFRGQICSDTPVWQPSATLGWDFGEDFGAISANVWASMYFTDKGSPRRGMGTHEIDYTIQYEKSFGPFAFTAGCCWWTYPNQSKYDVHSTCELFAGVSYENDVITPSVTAYWDCFDNGGTDPSMVYVEASLEHEFELTDCLTLTPSVSAGLGDGAYMNYYSGVNRPEFADLTAGLDLTYSITENIYISGVLNYTWIMSHTLRRWDYMGNEKDQLLYGGVSVGFEF